VHVIEQHWDGDTPSPDDGSAIFREDESPPFELEQVPKFAATWTEVIHMARLWRYKQLKHLMLMAEVIELWERCTTGGVDLLGGVDHGPTGGGDLEQSGAD
jgi:hypothetical protein